MQGMVTYRALMGALEYCIKTEQAGKSTYTAGPKVSNPRAPRSSTSPINLQSLENSIRAAPLYEPQPTPIIETA